MLVRDLLKVYPRNVHQIIVSLKDYISLGENSEIYDLYQSRPNGVFVQAQGFIGANLTFEDGVLTFEMRNAAVNEFELLVVVILMSQLFGRNIQKVNLTLPEDNAKWADFVRSRQFKTKIPLAKGGYTYNNIYQELEILKEKN